MRERSGDVTAKVRSEAGRAGQLTDNCLSNDNNVER